jgi:hypothetical protein
MLDGNKHLQHLQRLPLLLLLLVACGFHCRFVLSCSRALAAWPKLPA